ncbi:LysR family transcriptional regulator [Motiliproteus sp. MSK22-1]|uniref:LysR family transcriptional regulator n=1 Tax=Motiliproteus sp. MSK22-1 TaxID=1897630 RepID=UPI0009783B33|nr:LysR family transcriptional regulator [Motiliproteus sp. MSK22-1]OMH39551.1 LysR family transcriptional regulator [Motiliproteus sp. MSK22-1]
MDLRKLHIFSLVAKLGSFTGAAKSLHMAQPAVSIAVRKLEAELELELFHRQDKQVLLTAEGEALLRHTNRILDDVRQAHLEMDELRGLRKGEVRIGIPSMLGSYYFPEILMAFKLEFPDLQLTVIEAGARDIQKRLASGELDMGIIVGDEVSDRLETQALLREEMVVCVPDGHPFADKDAVGFSEFFDEQLVLFKEGYFHREFIDRLCASSGRQLQIAFETNLIHLIRSIVKKGFGITTFLRMVVTDDSELVAVPFEQPVWLELCIAWKKGAYLSHADRCFVKFLLKHNRLDNSVGQ